jgi:hypothetical protein
MKSANVKTWLAAVSFLLLAAPAGLSFAHTQDGSLGAPTAATDYYQITCSDDGSGVPASMQFQIQNRGPTAAVVSVLVHKGIIATSSSDATAGDASLSPLVWVNGGDGVYNVFVIKAADGGDNYTLTYHCMTGLNGGGLHTGTTLVVRQNQ